MRVPEERNCWNGRELISLYISFLLTREIIPDDVMYRKKQ